MNQAFGNPTKWNEFYEKSWDSRRKIMSDIIDSGETNPLRVVNLFLSSIRLSNKEQQPLIRDAKNMMGITGRELEARPVDVRNVMLANDRMGVKITPHMNLPGGRRADMQHTHRNKFSVLSSYTDCDKMDFLSDYCQSRNFDAVIELGSGYGGNLVKLFHQGGPKVPYFAGEFTQSGTQCADMLNALSNEFEINSFRFDFRYPDFSSIPKFENVLVFTCHSIEQVDFIPDKLIPDICKISKNVTCIHMEPFGFQMVSTDVGRDVDKCHKHFFMENGWNQNLLNQLVVHTSNGNIDLEYIGKNALGGDDSYSPSSLAVWKSL